MIAWTTFAVWAYGDARRRRPLLLLADLAVALGDAGRHPAGQGRLVQRDAARLLDRGRAAGLGDPLALAGRVGGRRLPLRGRSRDPARALAGQLRQRLPDHDRRPAGRLPLRLPGHHGRRARPGAAQCRGGGRADAAGPGRPRRRAPGPLAGAAARPRAGWGVRRSRCDGGGAGVAAALADPSAGHRGRAGDRGGPRPRRRPRAARVPEGDGVDARGAGPHRRQPRCGDRGRRARLPGQRRRLTSAPRRRPGCCSRSSGPTSW